MRYAACCVVIACSHPVTRPAPARVDDGGLAFDIHAIDPKADPCTSFYDYACGGWRSTHPIPPDRSRWSRYAELEELDLAHERTLVEAAPAASRVGAYYAACMDTAAIEARGLEPIRDLLGEIDAIATPSDVVRVLADLQRRIGPLLFSLMADADPHDVHTSMATLDVGELGLDAPDDYGRDDADTRAMRASYQQHVERLLGLAGDRDASADAARVLALETSLAGALPRAEQRRERAAQVHVMSVAELATHAPAIDWPRYLAALEAPPLARVNVTFVPYLEAVGAAVSDAPSVRAYLRYQVVRHLARVLPSRFDDEVFSLAKTLRGSRDKAPRWQRCLDLVDRDLGDDVGKAFVAAYFPPAARDRAKHLVDRIVGAMHDDLASVSWLGASAREAAIRKLANMRFTIGYRDRWIRYDDLTIRRDDPVGNSLRGMAAFEARDLAKLTRPPDRDEFFALPQQLDGFGTKTMVSVGFTAGFLQPPVFDARIDDPINFGGFGGVIGHEITHHFDDQGRTFDVEGNIAPWWSDADVTAFRSRAQCFVDEYSRFAIDDGTHVNGQLTLGENLADNGGLRLAWNALQPSRSGPRIDGFTPAQRFFLAWGQIRCENATPQAARSQVHGDGHSPGRFRVDGVVSNMPEFAEAFACKAGSAMAPTNRCRLW
jgi:predicted metalloendopeptidase